MFGINGGELLVLILIAIVVIGPERMPEYAAQLRRWVVRGRDWVNQGKDQVKSEVGDQVDWTQYDPRQYDPRRIVREALAEPSPAAQAPPVRPVTQASAPITAAAAQPGPSASNPDARGAAAPFDSEAT
ncbi:hypothetical protein [Demequina globuliformis]|uniref:hypothetical protein n=1 Tax=Demequina globuliformis TaxID=676202 RepID=UPI0007825096|nr:hypothetical protein [Demequina globuliformis]